jgi:hypothetical protein
VAMRPSACSSFRQSSSATPNGCITERWHARSFLLTVTAPSLRNPRGIALHAMMPHGSRGGHRQTARLPWNQSNAPGPGWDGASFQHLPE